MSAKPDYVVNTLTRPNAAATTGGYVINLTSSTTPMALSQPKDPTLAQYTFFVSRRREDGRERFRLHMGYFETMQAEPARAFARKMIDRCVPYAERFGCLAHLRHLEDILEHGTGAQRQRIVYEQTGSLREVVRFLAEQAQLVTA